MLTFAVFYVVLPLPSGVEPLKNTSLRPSMHQFTLRMPRTLTMNASSGLIKFLMLLSVFVLQISGKKLSGVHFRFPAVVNPVLFIAVKGPDGNVTYKGPDKELADWLSASLNFTYSFVPLDPILVRRQGATQTTIDMLLNGTIDIILSPIFRSWDRKAYMDFTYPHFIEAYKLISPWPKEKDGLLASVKPFQTAVWVLIVLSLLAIVIFLTFLTNLKMKNGPARPYSSRRPHRYFMRNLMYVINNVFGQDDYLPLNGNMVRIVMTSWVLAIVVIVNSYSSQLVSFLTVPVYEKTVESFDDLVKRPDLPLTVPANSVFLQRIMEAKTGTYKWIADSIRQNPEHLHTSVEESFQKIFSGKYAFTHVSSYIQILVSGDYKKMKTCRMAVSKSLQFFDHVVYGLPKDGPYNQIINDQIIKLWETGQVSRWLKPFLGRYEQCIVQPAKPRMVRLKLHNLYSAFVVLFFGAALSIFIFVCENGVFLNNRIKACVLALLV